MRVRSLSLSAVFALAFAGAWFSAAIPAHADTYSVISLVNDNRTFYGMDDLGNVVFTFQNLGQCSGGQPDCFFTYLNGSLVGTTNSAPALNYDFSKAPCIAFSTPTCSVTYNGRTATAYDELGNPGNGLFSSSGGNPPQFITADHGIANSLVLNGTGDIVFDNGNLDLWYEAVDLTTTPEPSSLLLLATGMLGLAAFSMGRRQTV